ncbi:hypothetical protein [Halolamina salina]|uniref:DUF2335 domain-containing protein n=1 Tax=Halolamina salina TaxID=1220023 RepID=A0ABD6BBC5_9EURY
MSDNKAIIDTSGGHGPKGADEVGIETEVSPLSPNKDTLDTEPTLNEKGTTNDEIYHSIEEDSEDTQPIISWDAYLQHVAREETKDILSDGEILEEQTEIPHIISDRLQEDLSNEYDIEKDTIPALNKFKDRTIEFHKENTEIRWQRRLVESVSISAVGFAVLFFTFYISDRVTSVLSGVVGYTSVGLLAVIGIGFVIAGFSGIYKTRQNNV